MSREWTASIIQSTETSRAKSRRPFNESENSRENGASRIREECRIWGFLPLKKIGSAKGYQPCAEPDHQQRTILSMAATTIGSKPLLRIGEASRLYNVSASKLRQLCDSSAIDTVRVFSSSHRRLKRDSCESYFFGAKPHLSIRKVLIYARVSTSRQAQIKNGKNGASSDLKRQKEKLISWAEINHPELEIVLYCDTSSGANLNRSGFSKLIDNILAGKHNDSLLICTNIDRLTRCAIDLIKRICGAFGISIIETEQDEEKDISTILMEEIFDLITIYQAKRFGSRSKITNEKHLNQETTEKLLECINGGLSIKAACKLLNEQGYTTEDGSPLGYNLVYKKIYQNKGLLAQTVQTKENPTEIYKKRFVQVAGREIIIPIHLVYGHYVEWAKGESLIPESKRRFCTHFEKTENVWARNDGKQYRSWRGMMIKGENFHFHSNEKPKRTNSTVETILAFSDTLTNGVTRWKGNQLQLIRRYREYCEKIGEPAADRSYVVAILKKYQGWTVQNEKGKWWFVPPISQ